MALLSSKAPSVAFWLPNFLFPLLKNHILYFFREMGWTEWNDFSTGSILYFYHEMGSDPIKVAVNPFLVHRRILEMWGWREMHFCSGAFEWLPHLPGAACVFALPLSRPLVILPVSPPWCFCCSCCLSLSFSVISHLYTHAYTQTSMLSLANLHQKKSLLIGGPVSYEIYLGSSLDLYSLDYAYTTQHEGRIWGGYGAHRGHKQSQSSIRSTTSIGCLDMVSDFQLADILIMENLP